MEECTCNGDALALAFAEPAAVFTARGVKPGRETEYELCHGDVKGLTHLGLSGIRACQKEVRAYGAAE